MPAAEPLEACAGGVTEGGWDLPRAFNLFVGLVALLAVAAIAFMLLSELF
jgi:hypothetical protein